MHESQLGGTPDYFGLYQVCRSVATGYDMNTIPDLTRRFFSIDQNGVQVGGILDFGLSGDTILEFDQIVVTPFQSTRAVIASKINSYGPSVVHRIGYDLDGVTRCETRFSPLILQPDIIPSFSGVSRTSSIESVPNVNDPSCPSV